MTQNLIFKTIFLKYFFGHTAFLYSSTRSTGHHQSFFLIWDCLIESLILQYSFAQKASLILWISTYLTLKTICSCNTAKKLSEFSKKFSSKYVSVWCQKKHLHFTVSWRSKLHSWNTLKANVRLFLFISVRKDIVIDFIWCGWVGGRLSNFINTARFLSLVKCFTIFDFKWSFCKFNSFLAFWSFHL